MSLLDSSMRDAFITRLFEHAKDDERVVILTNDFGAPALDQWREQLPTQFFHGGIAEANLVNVAAGLAKEGLQPYVYSISPFVPARCFEQIRVHVGMSGLPIRFVVVGAGYSYDKSGPTHHSLEDLALLCNVPNLNVINPADSETAEAFADVAHEDDQPWYIRLDRGKYPNIYKAHTSLDLARGWAMHGSKDPVFAFFATGAMVHEALAVAEESGLEEVAVVDVFRLHPFPRHDFRTPPFNRVAYNVTFEENFRALGHLVDAIDDVQPHFDVPVKYFKEYGGREHLRRLAGIDRDAILAKLKELA